MIHQAMFTTQKQARDAACAINDKYKQLIASYKRLDDKIWVVESKSITLAQFVTTLSAAGCDGYLRGI